jgi:hypothetical protein
MSEPAFKLGQLLAVADGKAAILSRTLSASRAF